jgi:hypothetical protein
MAMSGPSGTVRICWQTGRSFAAPRARDVKLKIELDDDDSRLN